MSTRNLCFEQKYEKYQSFYLKIFSFLEVKFSIYLNRRVFVMKCMCRSHLTDSFSLQNVIQLELKVKELIKNRCIHTRTHARTHTQARTHVHTTCTHTEDPKLYESSCNI